MRMIWKMMFFEDNIPRKNNRVSGRIIGFVSLFGQGITYEYRLISPRVKFGPVVFESGNEA